MIHGANAAERLLNDPSSGIGCSTVLAAVFWAGMTSALARSCHRDPLPQFQALDPCHSIYTSRTTFSSLALFAAFCSILSSSSRVLRHCRRPAEHPVHHVRRPRLPGDQRLWQQPQQDAEHRPAGEGGDAVRPGVCDQLDLRAQPGGDPDRQVQPPERLSRQLGPGLVQRRAADVAEAAAGGRLQDGGRSASGT